MRVFFLVLLFGSSLISTLAGCNDDGGSNGEMLPNDATPLDAVVDAEVFDATDPDADPDTALPDVMVDAAVPDAAAPMPFGQFTTHESREGYTLPSPVLDEDQCTAPAQEELEYSIVRCDVCSVTRIPAEGIIQGSRHELRAVGCGESFDTEIRVTFAQAANVPQFEIYMSVAAQRTREQATRLAIWLGGRPGEDPDPDNDEDSTNERKCEYDTFRANSIAAYDVETGEMIGQVTVDEICSPEATLGCVAYGLQKEGAQRREDGDQACHWRLLTWEMRGLMPGEAEKRIRAWLPSGTGIIHKVNMEDGSTWDL